MPAKKIKRWEAAIVGGGIAGLSAAIYLGRAQREALVIDAGKSLAIWEPEVQNYLGFPDGISGAELLRRGRKRLVGDIYHNALGRALGVKLGPEGDILIDPCQRTNVPGVYAAGCLTPVNCQMIIAAGQGAAAGQAINRDIFEASVRHHVLRLFREEQMAGAKTVPEKDTKNPSNLSADPGSFNAKVERVPGLAARITAKK